MKDFKWVIRKNQIKDCPVTVQYIYVALKIWGKNITSLKGHTTWIKTIPVARDYVKVPLEPQYHVHSRQPPRGLHDAEIIQGLQGDLSVLSPTWLSHHSGAR
jgi:hypothetical protein